MDTLGHDVVVEYDKVEAVLLDELARGVNDSSRLEAARLLDRLGAPATADGVHTLLQAARDENGDISLLALKCLSRTSLAGLPEAVSVLSSAMKDCRPEARLLAVTAARGLGPDLGAEVVSDLIEALKDDDVAVRREALATVGAFGPEAGAAVPAIVDIVLDRSLTGLHDAAFGALLAIDPQHRATVARLSQVQDEHARSRFLTFLRAAAPKGRALRKLVETVWKCDEPRSPERAELPRKPVGPPPPGRKEQVAATHSDGPGEGFRFWWKNKSTLLPPIPHKLLSFLWGRDGVEIEDAADAVWGEEKDSGDAAIASALNRINKAMRDVGAPNHYGVKQGQIINKTSRQAAKKTQEKS